MFLLLIFTRNGFSQKDTTHQKIRKNTLRICITNPIIFGNSYIFGYERLVGRNQSFSVNFGTLTLPKFSSLDLKSDYNIISTGSSSGYNISGDYRFYLGKVNKFDAPRGVYIGPYIGLTDTRRSITLSSSDTGQFDASYKFNVISAGCELGYQFVFWDRLSLDMILLGPGIAGYSLKKDLSTTLSPADEEELFQKINDALAARIPGYSGVIEPGSNTGTGTYKTTSLGFRYMIMLGFRF